MRSVQIGQRFGRGVVIDPQMRISAPGRRRKTRPGARLLCDPQHGGGGNEYETRLDRLFDGDSQSCGCLMREVRRELGRELGRTYGPMRTGGGNGWKTTHGLSRHPLYDPWYTMIQRCENPAARNYKHYGGRGIKVCPEWHDVAVFIAWIEANLGPRPEGMTLDRWPDNDGDYKPGNVRWATWPEQHANKQRRR
jgi:hypothetical protein